jgi:O-antigen/teichoic acid export membrane protein
MKPPVVILSSIEWGAAWQRHQAFASQWAASGHEVFFVQNTGLRNPRLTFKDASRLWRHLASAGSASLPKNLHLITPRVLPPTFRLFRALNEIYFVPRLAANLPKKAVVICYLPTSTTLQLLAQLEPSLVLYDCVDNFHGLDFKPADLAETEASLLAASALVVTTSRTLYEDMAAKHSNVLELHHGAAPGFFLPPHPKREPRKLCYFGTLWNAVDYAPVRALAEAGFEVTLLGPRKETPPPLPGNVRFAPLQSHDRLPQTLYEQDALLLPYRATDYNRGVVPSKLYECLATGRPVLASPLPALEPYSSLLYIANSPEEWVQAARKLVETETSEKAQRRVAAAREHGLERQFAKLKEAAESAVQPALPLPAPSRLSLFVRGFAWIGAFYGLAKAITLFTQTLAGRLLGPVEYGKANLIVAIAAYLQIAPMLGFPLALAKLVPDAAGEAERRRLISAALGGFFLWAALMLAAFAPFAPPLTLALAFCTALYTVVSSILLGLRRFNDRGMTESLYGLLAFSFSSLFLLFWSREHSAFVLALCASLLLATGRALYALRGLLHPTLDWKAIRPVLGYAFVGSLNYLAAACVLAPGRVILNSHFSAREVGVFSAYFTATTQVSLALLTMSTAVILPLAGGPQGQEGFWKPLRRYAPKLAPALLLFFSVAAVIALKLFGRQYPLRWDWVLLFAGAASLILAHGVAAAILAARDFSGLCLSVSGSLVAGLTNVGLGLLLIPRYGIAGAGAALATAYVLGLLVYWARRK